MPKQEVQTNILPLKEVRKISLPLSIVFIVLAALISGFGTWYYFVESGMYNQKTITVTGKAMADELNEIQTYTLNIERENEDKTVAVSEASDIASKAVEDMKTFGIPAEDIKTSSLNVYQKQEAIDSTYSRYEKTDWVANYSVEVVLKDTTKSIEFTKLLTTVEDASMWGPNTSIDTLNYDDTELQAMAIEDARQSAEKLAAQLGKKVADVIDIQEGGNGQYYPMGKVAMYEDSVSAGYGGGGFPIEGGTSRVLRTVIVTFRLR